MLLAAQHIRERCEGVERPMIVPFHERHIVEGRSRGLSGAGYDLTLAQTIWLWPLWMRLGSTVERFDIPTDLSMEIRDKSTNIRKGFQVFNTCAEPGWNGTLTVELFRVKPWPTRIKAGTPIAQAQFELLTAHTEQPYEGKYQGQGPEPQPAIMEGAKDGGLTSLFLFLALYLGFCVAFGLVAWIITWTFG